VKLRLFVVLTLLCPTPFVSAQSAAVPNPTSAQPPPVPQRTQENQNVLSESEKARVFITDSQSWSIAAQSGGAGGAFGGSMAGGARPQTAEIIKTFGERCPQVLVNNIQSKLITSCSLITRVAKGI